MSPNRTGRRAPGWVVQEGTDASAAVAIGRWRRNRRRSVWAAEGDGMPGTVRRAAADFRPKFFWVRGGWMGAPFGIVVVNLARISSRPRGFARNPFKGEKTSREAARTRRRKPGSDWNWPNVECRGLTPLLCQFGEGAGCLGYEEPPLSQAAQAATAPRRSDPGWLCRSNGDAETRRRTVSRSGAEAQGRRIVAAIAIVDVDPRPSLRALAASRETPSRL